jgi:hypothetical protein
MPEFGQNAIAPQVRDVIHSVDPKASIGKMETIRDDLFDLVATEWFYTLILGLFGAGSIRRG